MHTAGKYGEVLIERGDHIPDGEPLMIIRAADKYSVQALMHYAEICDWGNCSVEHVNGVRDVVRRFAAWQEKNPDSVRLPGGTPAAQAVKQEGHQL